MTLRGRVAVLAVVLAVVAALGTATTALAVTADVTITATPASNGTTTLTYRATATTAGTVRYIQVSIPPGSTGRITSVNGTVTTVAPNVLRWTPSRRVTVGIGARFSLPFYGLRLPAGGPWRLGFNAPSTTGTKISYGIGVLQPLVTKVYTPDVQISASNPVPGEVTTLYYRGVVTQAGSLSSIVMQLPPDATGAMTSVNGSLTVASGHATWTARSPISVAAGTRLSVPIYGVALSRFGGVKTLAMSARTATGATLMFGTGTIAFIAPPAAMPEVPVADFAPVPDGCPSSWPTVAEENALLGSPEWVIEEAGYDPGAISTYLTKVSATCGASVDLKVTSGKPVDVVAYRMGYYAGLGAREVWRAEQVPTVVQPPPTLGGYDDDGNALRMVSAADWSPTLTIPIDHNWVPGTYLIRVDDGTNATYAPLTVRDDTGTRHDILIQQATTTWAAYNAWGGESFYTGLAGSGRLSFDRPYDEGQGSGQFLPLEQGLVFWAESKGLDVTYWTDNDLDEFGGQLPARASTVFLPAHDEYYTPTMRAALSQAIDHGVNVASLGANQMYRLMTFTSDERREWDIDRYSAGYSSTTWRWLGDSYASQPLLGAEYVCRVTADTLTTGTSWLFEGITPGTPIPGFLAGEIDTVDVNLFQPPDLETIATGSAPCAGDGLPRPMSATAFTAASGARVVNASTFAVGCFLVGRCPANWTVPTPAPSSQQSVGIMMANITQWVTRGDVTVPSETTTARMKVAVPKQTVQLFDQP